MPATARVVPKMAIPMPPSPQNSSSLAIGRDRPVSSAHSWASVLEAVQADLAGLLQDRPGRLLALVPLGCRRSYHRLGEAVHPVAQVALFLGEVKVEGHRHAFGMSKIDVRPGRGPGRRPA